MFCRLCNNELSTARIKKQSLICSKCEYEGSKDLALATGKRYRDKNRKELFDHYGNECAFCHATEDLHIDHIDGQSDGITGNQFYRRLKVEGYPTGYQTLCRQCNIAKQKMNNDEFSAWIVKMYNALQAS